ncbi:MAG: hypothetical protein A2Y34_05965 [Spirochaetes bacterium GWC1_27_15]|nr:MAG: hypothetical protein A2Z98_17150 [Spirochaetes bacterium GWB1_27_13]OHD22332.1 MAG: hypothetical protein A2Y34_05965 [Spirochaetes bacterium GWC1_27_15]
MEHETQFYINSPIDDKKLGPYKNMNKEEVLNLAKKAENAKEGWKNLSIEKRLSYIKKMLKVIIENANHYTSLIQEDNGKTKLEALTTEIFSVVSVLEYYIKHSKRILKTKKVNMPLYLFGKKGYIFYEPLGVVGVVAPWNYPFHLSFVPAISAVIAGNTVLVKHSSQTPNTGLIIEDIIKKSGLPDGVLNVVWGKGYVGEYILSGNIQKLFFTGSTEIGKKLAKICAEKLIPYELELGGSDPAIILDSANLERAANGVVWGSLLNSGQTCISVERVYVTEKNYAQFIEHIKNAIKKVKLGSNIDCHIGAMTSKSQIDIVKKQLDEATQKGAKILLGGNVSGSFFEPTLIVDCTNDMSLIKEETFGPVVAIVKTKNDEESLMLANDSRYGLSSSIYGEKNDVKKYFSKIEAGTIVANNSILALASPALPFGGVKDSGIGRYRGEEGLKTFCNVKSVMVDKLTFMNDFVWYPYGHNGYNNYLNFIKKYFGSKNPLKILSALPLIFKKHGGEKNCD